MGQRNATTNSGKHPFDRIDCWVNGDFDFLLDKNYGTRYHNWVLKTKEKAKKQHEKHNKQNSLYYPNNRK